MGVAIFLAALAAPLIYYRILFAIAGKIFDKPFVRTRSGLQVHHLHYGVVYVFIAALVLLFSEKNLVVLALLGLGLGLILDDIVASLLVPGNRPAELLAYKKSLRATIWLFVAIAILIISIHVFTS